MILKKENFYGLVVFIAAFWLYLKTLAPSILLWDAAEWVTVAYNLGISHPPGAPVYILIAHLFSKLPLTADVAFRVNLLSACAASGTVYLVFRILTMLLQHFGKIIAYSASFFAAASLAVSHTFWLNAIGAEVYAPATFLAAFIIYLMLRHQQGQTDLRYLLLIFYLFGLSIGVHLIVVLIFPAVLWCVLVKNGISHWKSILFAAIGFVFVYPGLVKWLPQLAAEWGGWIYFVIPVSLLGIYVFADILKNDTVRIISVAAFLLLLGFSSYLTVFIRSDVQPAHQGEMQSAADFSDFMNRSQYGEWQQLPRRYQSDAQMPDATFANITDQADFFWHYQLNHMYLRYFGWNFISPPNSSFMLAGVLLLLGLLGLRQLFRLDGNTAIAFLVMFICSGVVLVWYLNQPNPQPRERDYIYVISFLIYFIWSGIGCAALLRFLNERISQKHARSVITMAAALFFLIGPVQTLLHNYNTHDFSENTFAREYAENLLNTCEPNAILFTGGDNDTYPLWYAQQVCGIRRDVSVVNVSMLNDSSFVRTLDIDFQDVDIQFHVKQPLTLVLPSAPNDSIAYVRVRPVLKTDDVSLQNQTVLSMVLSNSSARPVYFAAGVAEKDMLGLTDFLRLDGLAYKLVPERTRNSTQVNTDILNANLSRYRWKSLSDNLGMDGAVSLIQQYQIAHMLLVENLIDARKIENAVSVLQQFEARLPFKQYPFPVHRLNLLVFYSQLYGHVGLESEQLRLARLAVQYLPENDRARTNLMLAMQNFSE